MAPIAQQVPSAWQLLAVAAAQVRGISSVVAGILVAEEGVPRAACRRSERDEMPLPQPRTSDRDRLIAQHINLPDQILARRRRSNDPHFDDMRADGYTGLLKAATKFDPARGTSFKTFAWHYVDGAIRDGAKQFLGRRTVPAAPMIGEDTDDNAHRKPTFVEYSEAHSSQSNQVPSVEEAIDQKRAAARLREHLSRLPKREQQIAKSYYFAGKTIQETAAEIGYNEFNTCRFHRQMLRQLREALSTTESP